MREDLRAIVGSDYWVYGLGIEDFNYTLRLAEDFARARRVELDRYAEKVRREEPEQADDILDDPYYYLWIEEQYLWHFFLWRCQAILEGIIEHRLLKDRRRRLLGLKARLDALLEDGFTVTDQEYEDLLEWASVRNTLSHAPPEQYRPGPLTKDDAIEYMELCKALCTRWLQEPDG